MNSYNLSGNQESLLVLKQAFEPKTADLSSLSPEKINEFNNCDLSRNSDFKALYRPIKKRKINMESYLIPVENANIPGFLFTKKKESDRNKSLIVYFHGGGWTLGNQDVLKAICSNICQKTGAGVLAVDYRLSPKFKFPIPLDDCIRAYNWAHTGARYWKLDPDRVFLMGYESGANLAIATALKLRDMHKDLPSGLILQDPITDCRLRTSSYVQYSDTPTLTAKEMAFFIANYQREPKDIMNPLFSPLESTDLTRLPQTLILSSDVSPLADDSKLLADSLQSSDVSVNHIVLNGCLHDFMNYQNSDGCKQSTELLKQLVESRDVKSVKL